MSKENQYHNNWTKEQISYIKKHYKFTTREAMAKHVGHPVYSLNFKMKELNLLKRPTPDQWDKLIADWVMRDLTFKQAALEIGVQYSTIVMQCKRRGIRLKRDPYKCPHVETKPIINEKGEVAERHPGEKFYNGATLILVKEAKHPYCDGCCFYFCCQPSEPIRGKCGLGRSDGKYVYFKRVKQD